jgi:hypothetical protein
VVWDWFLVLGGVGRHGACLGDENLKNICVVYVCPWMLVGTATECDKAESHVSGSKSGLCKITVDPECRDRLAGDTYIPQISPPRKLLSYSARTIEKNRNLE